MSEKRLPILFLQSQHLAVAHTISMKRVNMLLKRTKNWKLKILRVVLCKLLKTPKEVEIYKNS